MKPPLDARDAPLEQPLEDEIVTLHAEMRSATQHRDAALARMQETQRELERLIERARALLSRRPGSDVADGTAPPSDDEG
jgi:hypothetical protein